MLSEWCEQHNLKDVLLTRGEYHPYPMASEREMWEDLSPELRDEMIRLGEEYLNYSWPALPAIRFMDFRRDGNRSRYETLHFARRQALGLLVIAECMEGNGRFIDEIINGIWCLCEESFWGVPAHNSQISGDLILPDVTDPIIDLFAAETGGLLAWTYYLLKPQLDAITPLITERIKLEVKYRILDPFLERNDFWWMGHIRKVNNWNPWINSNCLTAFLILEDDEERRAEAGSKIMDSLDFFIEVYHPDGGCDEGTSYWGRAGASLFDCLEQLYTVSQGKIDFYSHSIVKEIGRFIYRSYIAKDYFINFADGGAKVNIDSDLVYRYGKRIGDSSLMAMGSSAHYHSIEKKPNILSLLRELPAIFNYEEINRGEKKPPYVRDVWMDNIQVMAAREQEGSSKGLYLAAKGGHNEESHNHNDIGNFIIYLDGKPVIIDIGVETYTAKTFSSQRYEIWTMQSSYHNLPTVNGIQQAPGEEYHATDVLYHVEDSVVDLSLDISTAYPQSSGIRSWKRVYHFNRREKASIEVIDDFRLEKETDTIVLSLMTPWMPCLDGSGFVILEDQDNNKVKVEYNSFSLKAFSEYIAIDDARLKPIWGDHIYRILFKSKRPTSEAAWSMKITQA